MDSTDQLLRPLRVHHIGNFFYSLVANQSEYGSYSFHICMFWYITYTIYSHHSLQNIRIQIFYLMQNKYMLKQAFASEQIFASTFSHTDE
jgi:hypothetical protein